MPEEVDGRRRRGAPHRGVAARPQGRRHLPRQLQGRPAARRRRRRRGRGARGGHDASRRPRGRRAHRRDVIVQQPVRQKLPRTRTSKTFSFRVADCQGYATVGEYEDGRPGEVFLKVVEAGLDARRHHGRLRDLGEPRPAVRRAARGSMRCRSAMIDLPRRTSTGCNPDMSTPRVSSMTTMAPGRMRQALSSKM